MNLKQLVSSVYDTLAIPAEKHPAADGRLRHIFAKGLIPARNVGTGKRAIYAKQDVVLVAAALQMNLLGITPQVAVEAVQANRASIIHSVSANEPISILLPSSIQGGYPATLQFTL